VIADGAQVKKRKRKRKRKKKRMTSTKMRKTPRKMSVQKSQKRTSSRLPPNPVANKMTRLNLAVEKGDIKVANKLAKELVKLTRGGVTHSAWRWDTVRAIVNIPETGLDPAEWKFGPLEEASAKDLLPILKANLSAIQKACGDLITGKEAKKKLFIDPFLIHTTSRLVDKGVQIFLDIEANVDGETSRGPVEYVVKKQGLILVIVEAKKDDLQAGLSQLIMELWSAKDSKENQNRPIYGITSTANTWLAIVLTANGAFQQCSKSFALQAKQPTDQEIADVLRLVHFVIYSAVSGIPSSSTSTSSLSASSST